jgi:hypothetical protein
MYHFCIFSAQNFLLKTGSRFSEANWSKIETRASPAVSGPRFQRRWRPWTMVNPTHSVGIIRARAGPMICLKTIPHKPSLEPLILEESTRSPHHGKTPNAFSSISRGSDGDDFPLKIGPLPSSFGDCVGVSKYATPKLIWQLLTGRIRDERVSNAITTVCFGLACAPSPYLRSICGIFPEHYAVTKYRT